MAEIDGLRRDLQAAWSEARTDGLTGLANRKHFDQALRLAAAQALEQGIAACLLLADIDHFKQFNDVYGHALGDQVLRLVASLLRHNVKGQDLVARYGGEEFAVILPATRLADAATLADRLRELVASRRVQLKDRGQTLGRVTLSIGVAEFRPGERCADWIARADGALYQAKREGRNRVVAAPGPADGTRGRLDGRVRLSAGAESSRQVRRAACRSQSAQASAGSGGQQISDCTASQPCWRRNCSWAWVSTPSATSRRSSSPAKRTMPPATASGAGRPAPPRACARELDGGQRQVAQAASEVGPLP